MTKPAIVQIIQWANYHISSNKSKDLCVSKLMSMSGGPPRPSQMEAETLLEIDMWLAKKSDTLNCKQWDQWKMSLPEDPNRPRNSRNINRSVKKGLVQFNRLVTKFF